MNVTVAVPATIANLGSGFDCMGLAVEWRNRVTVAASKEVSIDVTGPGAERIPRNHANLVLRAIQACERASGSMAREWAILIENETPYGRGLGSSACAIVAGVVAANALGIQADALTIAGEIEGHLDNVSAALFGGITVSGFSASQSLRLPAPAGLRVVACVAPGRLSTKAARAALPSQVPFVDAVHAASRAALLAAQLATGNLSHLLEATEDRLHQDARFALAPDSAGVCAALRAAGFAAFLSGAGPSISALVASDTAEEAARIGRESGGEGWDVRVLEIADEGATIVSEQRS